MRGWAAVLLISLIPPGLFALGQVLTAVFPNPPAILMFWLFCMVWLICVKA